MWNTADTVVPKHGWCVVEKGVCKKHGVTTTYNNKYIWGCLIKNSIRLRLSTLISSNHILMNSAFEFVVKIIFKNFDFPSIKLL